MMKHHILSKYPSLNYNNVHLQASGTTYKIFVRHPELFIDFIEYMEDLRLYQESHVVVGDIEFAEFKAKFTKALSQMESVSLNWINSNVDCVVKINHQLKKITAFSLLPPLPDKIIR